VGVFFVHVGDFVPFGERLRLGLGDRFVACGLGGTCCMWVMLFVSSIVLVLWRGLVGLGCYLFFDFEVLCFVGFGWPHGAGRFLSGFVVRVVYVSGGGGEGCGSIGVRLGVE